MFGFINVYKPEKMTSHDVVAKLRKITGIKQIGHTGTLDPFAQGVLPICIGKATRLIEYLNDDKEYIAQIQFGKNTDTYDIEGKVTDEFDKKITIEELINILKNFKGEIIQYPPIYSAIKVNGKKLYQYAREGKNIEIKPRKVFIKNINLLNFDQQKQTAEIFISCTKGTYIRSIAYDIGKCLNCGAYLSKLTRTKAGDFSIENSIRLENINSIKKITENILNPLQILKLPTININDNDHLKVIQGQFLENKYFSGNDFLILIYNNKIDAIAIVDNDKIKVKKVFV